MLAYVKTILQSVRRDSLSYAVIALGIVFQIILVVSPLDFLITNLLPDDAFYYFEIARNIANGSGSTFDGVNATNGYHPLWLLLLVPVYSLMSVGGTMDLSPIYAALGIAVVLSAMTSIVLLQIVARVTESKYARAFALMLWCLNPFVIYETLNGLETALALFLVTCFFLLAFHIESNDRVRTHVLIGVLAGFMILARIDLVFYFIAFLGWVLVRHGISHGVRRVFAAGIPATIIVLPWIAWNLQFGMVLTSASVATPLVNHVLTVIDNGSSLFESMKAIAYMLVTFGLDVLARTGAPWLLFIVIGATVAFTADRAVRFPFSRATFPLALALFLGFLALFFANAGIRFTGRSWYFISANLFLVLASAHFLRMLAERHRAFLPIVTVLSLAVVASFSIGWYGTLRDQMVNQRGMYRMAEWINTNVPADASVGVFNAGIMGYFASPTIVNLDGLVNNASLAAMQEYRLWSYIKEENIEYLADFDIYFDYRYRPFLDIEELDAAREEIVRIPVENGVHGDAPVVLYRVGK